MEETMARLTRVLSAAMIVGAGATLAPGSVHGQPSSPQNSPAPASVTKVARMSTGAITGLVSDEQGRPIAGARVTAIGVTMALAFTDRAGRFVTETLPAGEYVVRAHRSGFAASRREVVRVGAAPAIVQQLQMRRLDDVSGTTGSADTLPSRPIVAAGFSLPAAEPPAESSAEPAKDPHSHSETAWRLRHIKRSILKDRSNAIVLAGNDADLSDESIFGRAMAGAASFASSATSLFADLPLYGEVNLLTTSALGSGKLFSGGLPRGVAYLALGAPTPAGEWTARAAMSEGDLASWIVAGSFVSKAGRSHAYNVGLSYSTQEYQGGNPIALAAMRDGSRNAAEVFGFDRWRVTPWFELDYGARYARYGYLREDQGLMSPRFGIAVEPVAGTRLSALVTQRMVVPGAEEFLPRAITGPALPPERTFAPFEGQDMRVERARGLDLAIEHQFDDAYVLSIRRFYQNVDDQLVTMFRLTPAGSPESLGHYYVANAGSFDASGWAVRISTPPSLRLRGSFDYSLARAEWTTRNLELTEMAPTVLRGESEDIHDITTSVETDIPETATRFYLLYRVSTAFTRSSDLTRPGMDARFDVQVNQALPFGLAGTKWEVLVGLRNLFRDAHDGGSVYDELLVVRPPKRVIGGFLVRF
jgi:hypothetical protein